MKKEIYYCDDCNYEKDKNELRQFNLYDICKSCISARISLSETIVKIRDKCSDCEGKGFTKEFYGYYNDYHKEMCGKCGGTGSALIAKLYGK